MGGGVIFEEHPYHYAYNSYPLAERWVPVYSSSFPSRGSNDLGYYSDHSAYDANFVPIFFVQTPFMGDENLARNRKLDSLRVEPISAEGQNIGGVLVGNAGKVTPSSLSSKSMKTPAGNSGEATPISRSPKVDAPEFEYPNVASVDKILSQPRIISIPVISTDNGEDNSVNSAVVREEGSKRARAITEDLAAVLLQSCFRGHLVRRTEPLTQLRSIARVRIQLVELEEKASDVDFIEFARENPKARVKLTESLMNLLLQLDAIQGAHPSVREIRKAVAKEVIAVQERVDALLSGSTAVVDLPQSMDVEKCSPVNGDGLCEATSRAISETEMLVNESDRTALMALDDERVEPYRNNADSGVALRNEGLNEETVRTTDDTEMMVNESDRTKLMVGDDERDEPYGNSAENDAADCSSSVQSLEIEAPNTGGMETSSTGADGMQIIEDERSHPTKCHPEQPSANEAGERLKQLGEAIGSMHAEVRFADADAARMNIDGPQAMDAVESQATHLAPVAEAIEKNCHQRVRDEEWIEVPIDFQAGNGSEVSEEDRLHGKDAAVHKTKEVLSKIANELSVDGQGIPIQSVGVQSNSPPKDCISCPLSPRSPFEKVEKFDSPSTSDSEHQSDIEKVSARYQDASAARGNVDNGALVLKLTEENKVLKSLLVDVMKWNQLQATVMQDVNHRLGKVESKLTHRIDKRTKKQLHKGESKSRRMLL